MTLLHNLYKITVNINKGLTKYDINIIEYEIHSKVQPIKTTHLGYRGTQKQCQSTLNMKYNTPIIL